MKFVGGTEHTLTLTLEDEQLYMLQTILAGVRQNYESLDPHILEATEDEVAELQNEIRATLSEWREKVRHLTVVNADEVSHD